MMMPRVHTVISWYTSRPSLVFSLPGTGTSRTVALWGGTSLCEIVKVYSIQSARRHAVLIRTSRAQGRPAATNGELAGGQHAGRLGGEPPGVGAAGWGGGVYFVTETRTLLEQL
jgi:hypothetical protein